MTNTGGVSDVLVRESLVSTDQYSTRYIEAGPSDAPVVVLLHDGTWGGSAETTWRSFIPYLVPEFRIIAPDLLGFGGSDKSVFFDRVSYDFRIPQLDALVRHLSLDESTVQVVGNSYGGSMALRLASRAPTWLGSVTSVGGTGGPWRTELSRRELGAWDGTRVDLERIAGLLIERGPRFDEHMELRLRHAQQPGHYRALASVSLPLPEALRVVPDDPWPAQLAACQVPVQIIHGTRDILVDKEWIDRIGSALPEPPRRVLLDAMHSPNIDQPGLLAEPVLAFLRENLRVKRYR